MSSTFRQLLHPVRDRLIAPTLIVMGAPGTAADLVAAIAREDTVCYQMDRYQADQLKARLAEKNLRTAVESTPDVWDLPARFGSVVFPSSERGERELKIDLVEQSFHVLQDHGLFAVLSPIAKEQLYVPLLKKIYGKPAFVVGDGGTTVWANRTGDKKRRRHEVTFNAKLHGSEYIPFISRPGVFSYGQLDDGTKSLLDVLETQQGQRIVELGCGCGAAGIIAALRSGPHTHLTLADSNCRAVAIAELNARNHQLTDFVAVVTTDFGTLPAGEYDLVLANPPYFAQHSISQMFIERAHALMRRGGKLYLVTKHLDAVEPMLEEYFPPALILERRGYAVIVATKAR